MKSPLYICNTCFRDPACCSAAYAVNAESLCPQPAVTTETMYARTHEGLPRVNTWTLYKQFKKTAFTIVTVFIAVKSVLFQRY